MRGRAGRRSVITITLLALAAGCGRDAGTPVATPETTIVTVAPDELPRAREVSTGLPVAGLIDGLLPRDTVPGVTTTVSSTLPPCKAFTVPAANFDTGSPDLRDEAGPSLDGLAGSIRATTGRVRISGHTDPRPTSFSGGNRGLSEARAASVRDALIARSVDPGRFAPVEGRADTELVDRGTSEDALQRNRRVEVTVDCPTAPR